MDKSCFVQVGIFLILGLSPAHGDDAPMTTGGPLSPDKYSVQALPANIAPTAATRPQTAEVDGQPRMTQTHPNTLWDQEDIDHYKAALSTNPQMQEDFNKLKKRMDKRITKPLGVPVPQQAPDGTWMYPGDFLPGDRPPAGKVSHANEDNAKDIADLGIMYALTGDEEYGEFAKQMILAYADSYNHYGHPPGWTIKKYRSALDGRLTGQFLEDGFWLNEVAFGYDLIYNLSSFTTDQRNHIRDDLFKAIAEEFTDPVIADHEYLSQLNNRSALCAAGVLMAGYATDDREMINNALYGRGGTQASPTGGLLQVHLGSQCILPDGLWLEGSTAYQLSIVASALFNTAEILWHHGIDIYRYPGEPLKRLLDSSIVLSYPDARMTEPDLHDSGPTALLDDRAWFNNEAAIGYEYGYRRYHDPRYIPIIRNAAQTLSMTVHSGPPSLFLELPSDENIAPRPVENANFYSVGYGVLRLASADGGVNQLLLEYGPSAGHAHPSKLSIDFYALDEALMPLPGVIFPYGDPLDKGWYWTTVANCVLSVDEISQIYAADRWKFQKGLPAPEAEQLVYGPAAAMGIERAWSDTVYPGVTQDRALFMTPQYLADIFGAFSDSPHKYDMAWHLRGTLQPSLTMEPMQFPGPVSPGYNTMTGVQHASTGQDWSAQLTTPAGKIARFFAAANAGTEVITAKGHFYTKKPAEDEFPPVIIERRDNVNATVFGNVVDVSNAADGYVKGVSQEGGLDAGYAVLKIATVKGTDLCFTAYRPGTYSTNGLSTDAMQAFVSMDGSNVRAMYLGGGTAIKILNGGIERSDPGLAYVEENTSGAYVVGNPSPTDTTVTVTLPAIGTKSFTLKANSTAEITP